MWKIINIKFSQIALSQISIFILIFVFLSGLYSQTQNIELKNPSKIGLVLSGGGAFGFAHIPVLKTLDSLEIPIDYIAGTSMGGIAGALYSIGYTGEEIEQIAKSVDWEELFSDRPSRDFVPYFIKKDDGKYQFSFGVEGYKILPPSGVVRGQKISLLFSELTYAYEKIPDFDHLPIPYRCIAVDLLTGNEVVLKKGSLAKAMRSTMSIPTAFSPVIWGDSLLIDGGLLNNIPVDVIQEMGADFIIAVNVGRPLKSRNELRSMFSVLEQTVSIPAIRKKDENLKNVDIYIEPDLRGYNLAVFSQKNIEDIIAMGKEAVKNTLPDLIALKDQYFIREEIKLSQVNQNTIKVHGVNITGNSILSFKKLYDLFDIKPGDDFYIDTLASHITKMHETGAFKSIKYKINYIHNNMVDIHLSVKELGTPTIYRITIKDNKSLPFNFIFSRLGLKIGQPLTIDLLNQRINALYSLGYFETIRYEIEPVVEGKVHLVLFIEEKPQDLLRVGLHYDETNNFVGLVKLTKSNFLLKGLRNETSLALAGLTNLNSIFYYPSNKQAVSFYPYFRLNYKNIPLNMFGENGIKIAKYHNQSFLVAGGFGIDPKNYWDIKMEYNIEYMDITPIVSFPDEILFPSWKDDLHSIRINSTIDRLDNVLIPNQGIYINAIYEGSYQNIGSDLDYTRFELSLDYFKTISIMHTLHFYTYYGYGTDDLPVYKWHYKSGPDYFVGAERDEIAYYHISIFRADYRRKLNRNLYLKFIYNIAPNYEQDYYPIDKKALQGYGLGLTYNTVVGPIELIYSRGDNIKLTQSTKMKNVFYLSMGIKF
ncbi:MAG: patatin-like phospholipase family protein [Candidatus Marinimicrobia bacterium]|nr:patatin-like phospholipase family protein [Candidatus Neomarinimicrobiota bacterium]